MNEILLKIENLHARIADKEILKGIHKLSAVDRIYGLPEPIVPFNPGCQGTFREVGGANKYLNLTIRIISDFLVCPIAFYIPGMFSMIEDIGLRVEGFSGLRGMKKA